MKDLLLKASVNAINFKDRAIDRASRMARGEEGDLVQVVIIMAIIVVLVVGVFALIVPAIEGQAKNTSNCITNPTNCKRNSG